MEKKEYYMVEFTRYNYEFEIIENFFFKDKSSAELYVTKYLRENECRDSNITWDIEPLTFDELKEEITVAEFEELFGIEIADNFD